MKRSRLARFGARRFIPWGIAAITLIVGAGALVYGSVPHVFNTGDTLQAADLNSNFTAFDQRITALESAKILPIAGSCTAASCIDITNGSGLVGIKAATGASNNAILAGSTNVDGTAAVISSNSGDPSTGLAFYGTGGIYITGTATKTGGGSWTAVSDVRLKKGVNDYKHGLSELLRVRPVTYQYNGLGGTIADGREYVGVLAQELEKIAPKMVTAVAGKLRPSDSRSTDILRVDPSAFTYMLINAVREQQKVIEGQERRIQKLERERRPAQSSVLSGHDALVAR